MFSATSHGRKKVPFFGTGIRLISRLKHLRPFIWSSKAIKLSFRWYWSLDPFLTGKIAHIPMGDGLNKHLDTLQAHLVGLAPVYQVSRNCEVIR